MTNYYSELLASRMLNCEHEVENLYRYVKLLRFSLLFKTCQITDKLLSLLKLNCLRA